MNYKETLQYLYSRLPMYQRVGTAAYKKDLSNTLRLLEGIGNPHNHIKSVHVAGTNGKGTSSHALSAILQKAGYKTGLYTSPHLKSFTERIRVDGNEVDQAFVVDFVQSHQVLIEQTGPSFFELTVAMAFDYFHRQQVDVAVIETGLGGRLDSTNVILPIMSLITMIGWDHAEMLGNTLEQIAAEKAGIIKPGRPVVIGGNQPELLHVFEKKALQCGSKLVRVGDFRCETHYRGVSSMGFTLFNGNEAIMKDVITDITADYFLKNVPGVVASVDVLREEGWNISNLAVYEGLAEIKQLTGLKGRWQILSEKPMVVADISHNLPGLTNLFDQVRELSFNRVHLIFGIVKDKDLSVIFRALPKDARYYFTQSEVPRSMKAEDLHREANTFGLKGDYYHHVNEAITIAKKKARKDDLILICGSTFVVAEIEEL